MVRKYTFAFLCIAAAVCGCNKEETPSEPVSTAGTVFSNGAVLTGSYEMTLRPFSVIEV